MVAYSFNTAFIAAIEDGTKRQTIRLPRKRHARPGETVQLFAGMRTKRCRKIIADPLCVGVDEVRFDLRYASGIPNELSARLEVNGIPIIGAAADAYAAGDGFGNSGQLSPFEWMAYWWYQVHGRCLFEGVAIRWEPRP